MKLAVCLFGNVGISKIGLDIYKNLSSND